MGSAPTTKERMTDTALGGLGDFIKAGPAPVFDQNLYPGAGSKTRNAWAQGSNLGDSLVSNRGLLGSMGAGLEGTMDVANDYGALGRTQGGPSLTEEVLMNRARGNEFGTDAPGFQQLLDDTANDVATRQAISFASTGNFGSGEHQQNLSRGLTSALAPIRYQNYRNNMADQMGALSAIENQRQTGFGNQLSTLAGRLGANQTAFGMEQQGVNNALAGQGLLTQIGQAQDADAQAGQLGLYDLFNRQNGAEYDHLAKIFGLLGASPDQQRQPGLLDYLGLGLGAAARFA